VTPPTVPLTEKVSLSVLLGVPLIVIVLPDTVKVSPFQLRCNGVELVGKELGLLRAVIIAAALFGPLTVTVCVPLVVVDLFTVAGEATKSGIDADAMVIVIVAGVA